MNKKSQALIVILWILVILSILAVGIGHRVSLAFRLSLYQKDKLKALYLAKAGINRAIIEIEKDTNDYDAFTESWADSEDVFKKIVLNNKQDEFATVSYDTVDENNETVTIYGVIDEESKININTASQPLLLALLEKYEISPAQDTVNYILIWRGDIPDDNKIYENLGYPCKSDKFTTIQELKLVKDIDAQGYQVLKGLITVYGDDKVNINTVSLQALTIFCRGIAKELSIDETFADNVAAKIIELRNSKGFFKDKGEISIILTADEETNIFNNLMNDIILKSENFLIESEGFVSKIKGKIVTVYSRKDKKILYWHES